jgi:signal transduction histidine kinase
MLSIVLHEFLVHHRSEILDRSRSKLSARHIPTPTATELKDGLPLFLDQLTKILATEKGARTAGHRSVATSAAVHGGELLRAGLTVGQVVQDYGSICQSVTELADEHEVAITADEFQTFNSCLDDAIAQAVTAYEHKRDRQVGVETGVAHLGYLAHEMRNLLTTSMLTFEALAKGSVGVHGSTGTLLGQSLQRMRLLIDRTLTEVRLEAGTQKLDRVCIADLMQEMEIIATLEAKENDLQLSVDPGSNDVAVEADYQILSSVVANLVQNALKFSVPHGHIKIRAHAAGERVLIDVADECGGLPPGKAEDLFRPFEQRGDDQKGIGLGLSISLKGVEASGGMIRVVDRPGVGCTFTVDLPRSGPLPS